MLKCECGAIISNGHIIKGVSVIEVSKDKKQCNVKCRHCKRWLTNVPIKKLFTEEDD